MILKEKPSKKIITKPGEIADLLRPLLVDTDRENLMVIGLDSRNVPIYIELAGLGTVNECLISVTEVFRLAIIKKAVTIIVAHNHPSNDSTPSDADIVVTKKLAKAGEIIGIKLLDHVVITEDGYCSLKATGGLN